jgi:translocation and assembly module TamB
VKKRYWFLHIVLLCLLTCAVAVGFLFGTTAGTRLFIREAARWTGIGIEFERIDGQIGHNLKVEGLRILLPAAELRIAALHLRWQPFYLVSGKVTINELSIRDILIEDKRPDTKTPIDLTWPGIPAWAGLIDGSIEEFRIERLTYQRLTDETIILEAIRSPVLWARGALLFGKIDAKTPLGPLEGNMVAGLVRPALRATLFLVPPKAWQGADRLSLDALFPSVGRSQPLSGEVSVTALRGKKEWLRLDMKLTVTPQAIDIRDLNLREAGRGGTISAQGRMDFSQVQPTASARVDISGLDVSRELKTHLTVSGLANLRSDFHSYQGDFDIRSAGVPWKTARLRGSLEGTFDRMRVRVLQGSVLDGSIEGEFQMSMAHTFSLAGTMQGRNLNPATITPDWKGDVNLNIGLTLEGSDTSTLSGHLDARILNSRLRDRPLSGKIDASLSRGLLRVATCELHGNGFDLSAHGALHEALIYEIRVRDLSGLIPHTEGQLAGSGWFRLANGVPAGTLKANGNKLSIDEVRVGAVDLAIQMEKGPDGPIEAVARVQGLAYGPVGIDSGSADIRGTAREHAFSANIASSAARIAMQGMGAYEEETWRGIVTRLDARDSAFAPWTLKKNVTLLVSSNRLSITPLMLIAQQGEEIALSADLRFSPRAGFLTGTWQNFNMGRLEPILRKAAVSGLTIQGVTAGDFKAGWSENGQMTLGGRLSVAGTLAQKALKLEIEKGTLNVDWDHRGFVSAWDVSSRTGGRLYGQLSSDEPARLGLPERARLQATWTELDVALLKPFYPGQLDVNGRLSGKMSGELLPGKRFDVQGETSLTQGALTWRAREGLMSAAINTASLSWVWRDLALRGKVDLVLSDFGHVSASFRLPIAPRLPPELDQSAPLQVSASGEMREKGMVSAFFPGLIQESKGAVSFDLATNGTWGDPVLRGQARLSGAGAYFPSAGIHLEDVRAEAMLVGDQIRVSSFSMRSGPGRVDGSATIWLKERHISRYEGKLKGDRFRAIYLPELQALIEPELSFEGTNKTVSVRGTIKVPELRIYLPETGAVRSSSDVVIIDEKGKTETASAIDIDGQVRIVLGDQVRVQAMGLNARLDGSILVNVRGLQNVTAEGEIRIPEGQYSTSGLRLDVTRGSIMFNGGPPDRAQLDVLALRKLPPTSKVKEVKAGVMITGTVSSPVVKLYSDPAMSEADILSYMLLGRPRATDSDQKAALARAAAAIAAAGPSSKIQDQIMSRIGLDTVDIESPGGDSTKSYVSLGKYLNPNLYVGLGYSLFRQGSFVIARYTLTKNWEIESQSGAQLGVDLYYKIEFY